MPSRGLTHRDRRPAIATCLPVRPLLPALLLRLAPPASLPPPPAYLSATFIPPTSFRPSDRFLRPPPACQFLSLDPPLRGLCWIRRDSALQAASKVDMMLLVYDNGKKINI